LNKLETIVKYFTYKGLEVSHALLSARGNLYMRATNFNGHNLEMKQTIRDAGRFFGMPICCVTTDEGWKELVMKDWVAISQYMVHGESLTPEEVRFGYKILESI
jgi:hypothetical protein